MRLMRSAGLLWIAVSVWSCARPATTAPSPQFVRTVLLEPNADESANVSIGDLNADGNLDLVLVKGRHSPRVDKVLFGNGRGEFPTVQDLGSTADRSYSGSLVDVDGDGDLDIVISNDAPDPKVIHLNDGTGRFRLGGTYGEARWVTRNATVADMNNDRLPDVVVANRSGARPGANYICLNKGGGQFDAECVLFSRESATTIAASDFNADGFLDLVVPHRDGGQSHVYVHDGKSSVPTFTRFPFGPSRANIRVAGVADLDGDRRLDIVTADERMGVVIYFGRDGPAFSEAFLVSSAPTKQSPEGDLPPGAPYALLVVDVDGNGSPDILVGKVQAPSTIHLNDGTGRRFTPVQFGDSRGTAYGFAVGDVDKDGRVDVAVARSGAPNVLYLASP
jgi:hypothetical protein